MFTYCIVATGHRTFMRLVLFFLQFGVGLWAYLWPGWTLPHKLALSPLHRFGGCATWLLGLATMAVRCIAVKHR